MPACASNPFLSRNSDLEILRMAGPESFAARFENARPIARLMLALVPWVAYARLRFQPIPQSEFRSGNSQDGRSRIVRGAFRECPAYRTVDACFGSLGCLCPPALPTHSSVGIPIWKFSGWQVPNRSRRVSRMPGLSHG